MVNDYLTRNPNLVMCESDGVKICYKISGY